MSEEKRSTDGQDQVTSEGKEFNLFVYYLTAFLAFFKSIIITF